MPSLYTEDIRRFVNTRDWPKGIIFEIREDIDPSPHLNIIFFRDNWLTLDRDAQFKATGIVKEIMDKLWKDGVPTYVGKMEYA